MKAKEIRAQYVAFFKNKQHSFVPSASLIIKDDPTLLFTNAGMNQFKDLFLGNSKVDVPRVCNSQKCLRVSGKHNDLEEVGVDTYHHTLFEMLGNWSFGDYFKKEAINWAWEFLVEVCKVNPENLYVTVFEGAEDDGLAMDQEAFGLWKNIIPAERILMGNKKDNFWEMGKTGPCGPCSEIHVDIRGEVEKLKIPGKDLVNQDHPQVIEVWNLVFMEFNRLNDGSLKKLPAQHVDTGMGFERLAMVLQGKKSNYDTDVFMPLIHKVEELSGAKYGMDKVQDIAIRVIVDHVRAVAFAIADGQMPANNGAGYVIRRILRRAVRYAYAKLMITEPMIYQLVQVLADQMGDFFPEINAQQELATKVIFEEESAFLRTLEKGIQRYHENKALANNTCLSGEAAFELYDTYGFPIDLTQLLAREDGMEVDMEGFKVALERQKNRSRQASSVDAGDWTVLDSAKGAFVGYDVLEVVTKVLKWRTVNQKGKTFYQIELAQSPFYPEGGGQVGDTGILEFAGVSYPVVDTKKENGLILVTLVKLPQDLTLEVVAKVGAKRSATASNHTATHLLHYVLRNVLGPHVEQKGSLVNANYLRFDFSHFQKITEDELGQIQYQVNEMIEQNIPLEEFRSIEVESAKAQGAMALFGEKYGDTVRMIKFGPSVELCGGIHATQTAQLGNFILLSESSVAAGIRRIEALSGSAAKAYIQKELSLLGEVKLLLKNPKDLKQQIQNLQQENLLLVKQIQKAALEQAKFIQKDLIAALTIQEKVSFVAQQIDLDSADAIKDLCFQMKQSYPNLFMVLGAMVNGKANLSVVLGEEALKNSGLKASDIIRDLAKHIQGGGGGQDFYATAGGKNPEGLCKALDAAKTWLDKF